MGCGSSSLKNDSSTENKPLTSRHTRKESEWNRTENTAQNAGISKQGSDNIYQTEKRNDPHETKQTFDLETTKDKQKENANHEELHRQKTDKIKKVQNDLDNLKDDLVERTDEILMKETKEEVEKENMTEQDGIGNEQNTDQELENNVTLVQNETIYKDDSDQVKKDRDDFLELEVTDAIMDDNSVVSMSRSKMDELDLFRGDSVLLKGKQTKETVCIVLSDNNVTNNEIAMNRCIRKNLSIEIGDSVRVYTCMDISTGERVCVLPFKDTVEDFTGDLFEDFLKPYFLEAYRPVHKGDIFSLKGDIRTIDFKVLETDPVPYCVVAPETVIHCDGEPLEREIPESTTKEDSEVLRGVMINKDVVHPKMKRRIENPRILLMDCNLDYKKGESHTNLEVAADNDFEAMLKQEEEHVRKMCDDIIAMKPDLVITEKGVSDLAQHFLAKAGISVIRRVRKSENNRIAKVSGATVARSTDVLTEENIGTDCGLFEIQKVGDEYFTYLLNCKDPEAGTILPHGPSQEKPHHAVNDAGNTVTRPLLLQEGEGAAELTNTQDRPPPSPPPPCQNDLENLPKDLEERITEITTSAREILDADSNFTVERNPTVSMDDIAGLEDVKLELREQILFPLMEPEVFNKFGQSCSYILLHGPPGCGKTMLAKAIAGEAQHCFISTKVSAGKYVPYTDDLRAAFDKARKCAPSILFLDLNELKVRSGDDSASMYLINQLLTELDGLNSHQLNTNLFVIGSVTSMHQMDPALLRPGRLSHLVHVPLPDEKTRTQILEVTLRHIAAAETGDLEHVASLTRGYTGAEMVELCKKALKLTNECSKENMNEDDLPKISRDNWTAALGTTQKSLSDKEVEFYEELNMKKDHFNFRFPRPPVEEEKHGGYNMGQFTTDEDGEELYNNGKTGNQLFGDDSDDDDLYS